MFLLNPNPPQIFLKILPKILPRFLLETRDCQGYLVREGRSMSGARGPLGQCSLCSSMPRDSSTVAGKIRRFLLSRISKIVMIFGIPLELTIMHIKMIWLKKNCIADNPLAAMVTLMKKSHMHSKSLLLNGLNFCLYFCRIRSNYECMCGPLVAGCEDNTKLTNPGRWHVLFWPCTKFTGSGFWCSLDSLMSSPSWDHETPGTLVQGAFNLSV